jgi:N6-adenosine-specific RNA methylase IME4/ParB-like chromosome segregation protein Spo0J
MSEAFVNPLPPLAQEERERLRADIEAHGVRVPVDVCAQTGEILDGEHRSEIAEELGIDYKTIKVRGLKSKAEREAYAIRVNVNRRNMSAEQRDTVREHQRELAKEFAAAGWTQERIGAMLGVAQQTVADWLKERTGQTTGPGNLSTTAKAKARANGSSKGKRADPPKPPQQKKTHRLTKEGKESIVEAYQAGTDEKQNAANHQVSDRTVRRVIAEYLKEQDRKRRKEDLKASGSVQDVYRVIYADPPWQYSSSGLDQYGPAERHYPTLSTVELCALKIDDRSITSFAQEEAVLFLWATSPLLPDALRVMEAWGFAYKSSFVWDKVKHNYGHYNSVRHEFLLIGTRGSCLPDSKKLHDSVITLERTGKHSAKPSYFRQLIDGLYKTGNRLELFAREKVVGWDNWGSQ